MKGKLLKVNRQKCLPVRSGFSWRVGRSWRVFPLIVLNVRSSETVSRVTNITNPVKQKKQGSDYSKYFPNLGKNLKTIKITRRKAFLWCACGCGMLGCRVGLFRPI